MNIGRMLTNTALRHPDRPAIRWGDTARSYRDFDRRSNALAHGLEALGVRRGDRIAVMMRNRPELLESMYACFKAGFCLVPLSARFTADEVGYHLDDSGAAAIITDDENAVLVLAALDVASRARVPLAVVVAGEVPPEVKDHPRVHSFEVLIDGSAGDRSAVVDVERDDLAWLFYTSGTTGRPKGAMLTHGNLAFATASWLADLTPMDETSVTLHTAPLTHGAGFHALAATARGALHVIPTDRSFEPASVFALIAHEGVTNSWMVPTQIVMLADAAAQVAPIGIESLTAVVYGGAPFAPAELRRALDIFGPIFVQLYAQGETPMTATVLPAHEHAEALRGDRPERLASAGFARPGMDVRVLGPDDVEVVSGEVGEICVRGPAVMLGYWQRPDETAEALRNGWLHTGDLGRMDDHGYVHLLDRAKDMIITGGSNVYAVEVEAAIASHETVRDVAVVGIADRRWGELVVAVVVTDADPGVVEGLLAAHCATVLAAYKNPRRFVFVDSLPRNAYGKVLKRELRATLAPPPA